MPSVIWYTGHDVLVDDIVRADGCSVFDSSGREYVDMESGVWCTSLGHGHPAVVAALEDQLARVSHAGFCYSVPVVEEAASAVLGVLGFEGGRCIFLNSGSEAVEYGVRVAQAATERALLLIMSDAYCGAYGSASHKRPDEWFPFDWQKCAACGESTDCWEGCEEWARVPWERIGGFLLEPGSSSGFVRFPPKKLVRAIVRRLRDSGGVVVVNEVTTGVARTGEWFGYMHYGIEPDIVAIGKGIGCGYPVSLTAISPALAARLADPPVHYAQSHQNDPLGASVVKAVIETIESGGLVERTDALGDRLASDLRFVGQRTGRIADVRGRGLLIAIDLIDEKDPVAYTERVLAKMVAAGFLMARRFGTPTMRIDPPLTISEEQLGRFASTLETVLTEAAPG